MRHRSTMCGLVAVAQLLASVAALDTFVMYSYGHMDSSCSPGGLSSSQTYLADRFCPRAQNRPGRMLTANDSHFTEVYFQEPGCDGTVLKTKAYEIDACVQVPPGGPSSGTYYKFSVERGESIKGRQYSGANCTGNFDPIPVHAAFANAFGAQVSSYSTTILDRCVRHYMNSYPGPLVFRSFLTVCSGSGVVVQKFPSNDCSGTVEAEREFPIGSCIEGEFLIEAPYCQSTTSTEATSDSSVARVNVPVFMGAVLLGLVLGHTAAP